MPALRKGIVTFGCLNRPVKNSPFVLGLWASVLAAVPGSRLRLSLSVNPNISWEPMWATLMRSGLPRERVELLPRAASHRDYLDRYNGIDIALDPFPYHGTATTCDALSMGVPVVTLVGATHAARVGASLLTAVGLPTLIASTPAQYIETAIKLGTDLSYLCKIRSQVRNTMLRSALYNAPRLARQIETAYREMWRRFCNR